MRTPAPVRVAATSWNTGGVRDGSTGILLAYYDDLYTRVDGEWLLASRELVIQYGGPQDLSAPFQNAWA